MRPAHVLFQEFETHVRIESASRVSGSTGGIAEAHERACASKVGREDWMLNVNANILNFRFDFVGGQNTKIHPKCQNSLQAQNVKISAVSTPSLTATATFSQHSSSSIRKINRTRLKTSQNHVRNFRTKI